MTANDFISSDQATPGTLRLGDLSVGRLGFGAMRITGPGVWGPPADRTAAVRLLRRVVELGITFIDTADSYGPGVSEELIAEALAPYPDGLVIATKGGLTRPSPGAWRPDRSRRALLTHRAYMRRRLSRGISGDRARRDAGPGAGRSDRGVRVDRGRVHVHGLHRGYHA
jgi:Aldo/keto reductase family